jgi:hypothetical protein
MIPEVTNDDLDDPGDRDGQERAEDAGELDGDQYRHQHGERVQFHRASQNQRLQDVVLELLVGHEEDRDDDQRRNRVHEGSEHRDDGAEGGSDERNQVGR